MNKKNILGVGITDAGQKKTLEYIVKNIENFKKKLLVVTPNPEFLVLASKNPRFKNILNRADLASADGIGVIWASKILGQPLKERLTGVDLVKNLCKAVAEKPITVGFLGGGDGVAESTAECLRFKYPNLKIGFVGEEWPSLPLEVKKRDKIYDLRLKSGEKSSEELINPKSYNLNHPAVDILFVAFGAPKQEFWISENLDKIPAKVAIGVGGAFDYISGRVPRAPGFIGNLGLEWLFRLIIQPWRIKRQLALIEFVWLVIKEKFSKN